MNRLAIIGVVCAVLASLVPITANASPWHKNCTTFNKKYAHGVGKVGAHDKTKTGHPVTTFLRSNTLYKAAMKANDDLDRDGDGIACETA